MTPEGICSEAAHQLSAPDWTPTREAGLRRLEAFLPYAGRDYARNRNVDRGPLDRSNVSALSPWIRRRLITEEEVIAQVLSRHSLTEADKFIQEVFWRTYWKGWLQMRPSVFVRYENECAKLKEEWRDNRGLRRALEGETGIEAFDGWVQELATTGWLHNHARMWFASIWIFTLNLPWQLGADVFLSRLIDADPASNTLSWRWVAGLHTPGKHYLARASNIRENTLGRYNPEGQLNEGAAPLSEAAGEASLRKLPESSRPAEGRLALLLTEEDLHPESWPIKADVAGCVILTDTIRPSGDTPATRFSAGALADACGRAGAWFGVPVETLPAGEIGPWMKGLGARELVTGLAPVGRTAQALEQLEPMLKGHDSRLVQLLRSFDARAWPHAKAGFFRLREKIPSLLPALP